MHEDRVEITALYWLMVERMSKETLVCQSAASFHI